MIEAWHLAQPGERKNKISESKNLEERDSF
jgi:hypothetical protein